MCIDVLALITTSWNVGFFKLNYSFTQNLTADTSDLSVLQVVDAINILFLQHFSVTLNDKAVRFLIKNRWSTSKINKRTSNIFSEVHNFVINKTKETKHGRWLKKDRMPNEWKVSIAF